MPMMQVGSAEKSAAAPSEEQGLISAAVHGADEEA